jgi:uncharacterized protein YerC
MYGLDRQRGSCSASPERRLGTAVMLSSPSIKMSCVEGALVAIRSRAEAVAFLKALCTPVEALRLQRRWQSLELRLNGATERTICRELGISMDTAQRCARVTKSADSKIVQTLVARMHGRSGAPARRGAAIALEKHVELKSSLSKIEDNAK